MTTGPQFPEEQSEEGAFVRQEDAFRSWIARDGSSPFPAASGRYHLYISLACPWASRTLIVRNLRRLQETIGVTVVDPIRDERGWAFREGPGHGRDPVNGFLFLREAYEASRPGYAGRVTVPVLWDKETGVIVNNSEDDICRMFNDAFADFGETSADLFPAEIEEEHVRLNAFLHDHVNNAVYEAGFATKQPVYEKAVRKLFAALDKMETRLASRAFLFGSRPVEADWRFFCTLIRFDPVYVGHFKCNLRRIADYPNLRRYLRQLYGLPGIAETVDFDQIKRHYYRTHETINPTRIVPLGPEMDLRPGDSSEAPP